MFTCFDKILERDRRTDRQTDTAGCMGRTDNAKHRAAKTDEFQKNRKRPIIISQLVELIRYIKRNVFAQTPAFFEVCCIPFPLRQVKVAANCVDSPLNSFVNFSLSHSVTVLRDITGLSNGNDNHRNGSDNVAYTY